MKNRLIFLLFIFLVSCSENKPDKTPPGPVEVKQPDTKPGGLASMLSYSILRERKDAAFENDSLQKQITDWLDAHENGSMDSLAAFLLDMTSENLRFTFGKCPSDAKGVLKSGTANCIGYAALFNGLMRFSIKKKGWSGQYECRHYVGKIWYGEEEVNAYFNDPFFKDHDFNVIRNKQTGKELAVDPSLYEYLGIRWVKLKKN